ncbi:IclR family transcriptional regulator [Rhodovibrionaceae bacterium A322]
MSKEPTTKIQGTQSFARSIALLQLIADSDPAPRLQDLLAASGLSRPTLYRLLAALEAERLVVQGKDKGYRPGPRLVHLARKALDVSDVRAAARPGLEALRDETGETVHLALRSGGELVYIDKIESQAAVRMASVIGTRVPFHSSGVGKAYLAALAPAEAESLMAQLDLQPITPFTTTDLSRLRHQVESCRHKGFIFDDQENETGIVCYGAALLDEGGRPAATVSVSVPLFRHQEDPDHYAAPLMKHCGAISRLLGYRP